MAILIGAFLDWLIGEPNNPGHPVRIIGWFAKLQEKIAFKIMSNHLKFGGLLVVLITASTSFAMFFFIIMVANSYNQVLGIIISGVFIYFSISARGLIEAGNKVVLALKTQGLKSARKELSFIVGRDTEKLNETEVLKGALETLAENICDGIIAPLFFIMIGGAPLGIAYKAINTLDSMFGYKNEKYANFGYFSAKVDDVANFIPARVSGLFIVMSSLILRLDWQRSWHVFLKDRKNHPSPNSAHTEAAFAGALGIQFGGPTYYGGIKIDKPFIGDYVYGISEYTFIKGRKLINCVFFLGVAFAIIGSGGIL